ncbi:MAG: DUF2207 domain-containing protein [Acidobacteriota bacterium]
MNMRAQRILIRRPLATVCLGLFFVSLSIAGRASAAEVIQFFDSRVQVAKDGELTVTETIRVHAEGVQMKHGIYRDFPTTFKDAAGVLREVTFSVLGVTRDGHSEPYFLGGAHNFTRIYAGNKDALLPHGDHIYVIRYQTGRQIRWFDGKPELNWNVTGNFWNFPILEAHYRLELASGQKPLRWTAYSGRLGAHGTNWRGGIGTDGVLRVSTVRPLAAGEGLTVFAALPGAAVDPPSEATLFYYRLFDNRRWIFAGIGFAIVFAFYLAAWNAVGRDPKRGTIIPLFHPPEGISPALANYIRDWGFGREKWRAFTAAALSLAVRGLIRLDRSGDALILKTTGRQADKDLPPGEGAILKWVSERGGSATIDRAHGKAVAEVGDKFTAAIEAESRNRFFRRNLGYVLAGVAMTAAVIFVVVNYGGLQEEDLAVLFAICFGAIFVGMFAVPIVLSLFGGGSGARAWARRGITLFAGAIILLTVFSMAHTMLPHGLNLPAIVSFLADYSFSFVLVIAFAALNGAFLFLMRAPTALGRPIMDKLAGFRLYLETAEKDRLNLQAPEITADRFEALLPYAVALDVEKPWARAFAAALRRANPDDADPMRNYQPAWSSGGGWSGHDFGSAVSSSISSVSDAFAAAGPSSSGSGGGGGGSGGGGGGGGGGGW